MKSFAGSMLNDANLAIKYLLQFDSVLPVPGIEKVEEIEENVDIVNGSWKLTPQEQQEMEDIRGRVGPRLCRRCGYCMPCPQGVALLPLKNMHMLWKLFPREWTLSWRYVTDGVESWKNCDQCGECEEKCPYHLPIQEMIAENIKFYESVTGGKK